MIQNVKIQLNTIQYNMIQQHNTIEYNILLGTLKG